MRLKKTVFAVVSALVLAAAAMAHAAPVTLNHNNSSVVIDPALQSGMSSWVIDGTDHMFQQWFWYRVGAGPEQSLDTLSVVATPLGTGPRIVDMLFTAPTFTIDILYSLSGGAPGSGTADVAESITITNTSGASLDFHFFQYSDFDLGGTTGSDIGVFPNANAVQQAKAGFVLSETIITPPASHFEMSAFPSIRNSLNDGAPTTLSDTPPIGTITGPADLTWAFQWDVTIGAGDSFVISKDKRIEVVPEPTSLFLLGSGLVGLRFLARRRRKA